MTDPMELVGRAEHFDGAHKRGCELRSWSCTCGDDEIAMNLIAQMAACIREMVEQKPFAHFQWNDGWKVWEQVVDDAAGEDGVVAAYRLPPAPGAE